MILVAAAMFALLGMVALVVDVGYAYSEKAKLQTMADASALAGASQLPVIANATQKSGEIALLNGLQITDLLNAAQDPTNPGILRVSVQRDVPTFFSKLFGINTFTVAASAEARKVGESWPRPPMVIIYPESLTPPGTPFVVGATRNFTYNNKHYYTLLPGDQVRVGTLDIQTGGISSAKISFPVLPATIIVPLAKPLGNKQVVVDKFAMFLVTVVSGNDITAEFMQIIDPNMVHLSK